MATLSSSSPPTNGNDKSPPTLLTPGDTPGPCFPGAYPPTPVNPEDSIDSNYPGHDDTKLSTSDGNDEKVDGYFSSQSQTNSPEDKLTSSLLPSPPQTPRPLSVDNTPRIEENDDSKLGTTDAPEDNGEVLEPNPTTPIAESHATPKEVAVPAEEKEEEGESPPPKLVTMLPNPTPTQPHVIDNISIPDPSSSSVERLGNKDTIPSPNANRAVEALHDGHAGALESTNTTGMSAHRKTDSSGSGTSESRRRSLMAKVKSGFKKVIHPHHHSRS